MDKFWGFLLIGKVPPTPRPPSPEVVGITAENQAQKGDQKCNLPRIVSFN